MFTGKLWLLVFVAIVLVIWPFFSAPAGAAKPESYHVYVVQPGDTLWDIAEEKFPKEHTGKMVYRIRELNGINGIMLSPNIWPGQRIKLPVSE